MSKLIGLLALPALIAMTATTANAAAWCAHYDVSTSNCGFHTYQQCLATISGIGGYCAPNYADDRGQRRGNSRRMREGR